MSKNKISIESTHPPFQKTDSYALLWICSVVRWQTEETRIYLLLKKSLFAQFDSVAEHFYSFSKYVSKVVSSLSISLYTSFFSIRSTNLFVASLKFSVILTISGNTTKISFLL
jgi:hypothetical protein